VVHGGPEFTSAVLLDESVEEEIERAGAFAPLHNPQNLDGIRTARRLLPERTRHVAVFDTAFHSTLSEAAKTYAGPYEWLEQGIRRYGFHGSSFRWASFRASQLLGRINDEALRLLICHLGGGCSLCATVGGRSIDTTMGFTPLDGIAMCTRSGAVDPGILIHLVRHGCGADDLEHLLNKESGLKGLSGRPGDTRVILPEAARGDQRARLAMDVFVHRLRAGMGQMLASLGELPDALVFTDAIAEDEPWVLAAACRPFKFLGLELDPEKNATSPLDTDMAMPSSRIRVFLLKSREAWQIVRECRDLLRNRAH
jgi:acetate kinase